MRVLVTGGAGFIGSAVIRHLIVDTAHEVLNVDMLTYAGNLDSLALVADSPRYRFARADIVDSEALTRLFNEFRPNCVLHLAAETHVDRSIDGPAAFIQTNVVGTFHLLQVAYRYWDRLSAEDRDRFRFQHISTDEVYGSLPHPDDAPSLTGEGRPVAKAEAGGNDSRATQLDALALRFTETTPYAPNSPYAASKASADHLVRAWNHTYGLPTIITNCSNNYGPCQFPEKLVPLIILNAIERKPLPVYGDGGQIRDWLYAEDHARALTEVMERGRVGEVYNIGGHNERRNVEVVEAICAIMDEELGRAPDAEGDIAPISIANPGFKSYRSLVTHVPDRPGHDRRYAIDASKIERELGWRPTETFETGLRKTVLWYLQNRAWWTRVQDGRYRGERLGLGQSGEAVARRV